MPKIVTKHLRALWQNGVFLCIFVIESIQVLSIFVVVVRVLQPNCCVCCRQFVCHIFEVR